MDVIEKLKERVEKEISAYPKLDLRGRFWYFVGNGISVKSLQPNHYSWANTILAMALMEEDTVNQGVVRYCDHFLEKGCPVKTLDQVTLGTPFLYLYKKTRNKKYLKAAKKIADFLLTRNQNSVGSYFYNHNMTEILVDTIGMICPFLSDYAALTESEEIAEIAERQIINFMDLGYDLRNGLPYHGYNEENKTGIIGWGRGVGWLLMGMAGYLKYHSNGRIQAGFQSLAESVLTYQDVSGLFHWQLEAVDGPADTSATAMILNGILDGIQIGVLDQSFFGKIEKGKEGLLSKIDEETGSVMGASGECIGLGQYPQRYGSYPWSDGPALALLLKLRKHEKEVEGDGTQF